MGGEGGAYGCRRDAHLWDVVGFGLVKGGSSLSGGSLGVGGWEDECGGGGGSHLWGGKAGLGSRTVCAGGVWCGVPGLIS